MAQAGYTPIQLYYSTTASAAPSSGNLANGELALNITDGKLYYKDNGGTVRVLAGTGGTGVVAGSNTQVQFNNNGVFGASSGLTWDGTNLTASQLRSSGLTSGRVTYAGASGLLVDSANMTFNGTRLTVADLADSGLTSGRVVYSAAGGALVDSANLLYSGTDLTVYGITVGRGASAVVSNTVVGASALSAITTGSATTAVGYRAGISLTTPNYNTFVGNDAGYSTTTGGANTYIGAAAGPNNATSTSSNNVGVGFQALTYTTSGASDTAVGTQALYANTTASNNTAVGYQAGYSNTTGDRLVAVGVEALFSNTSGQSNIAIGYQALRSNTSGSNNVAIGSDSSVANAALENNTTGIQNTAVGSNALVSNTTASYNTAIGYSALASNTTGTENTAIGRVAGFSCITGGFNAFIGHDSGYNTTSSYNTFVGHLAGYLVSSGAKNTILGRYNGNNTVDIRTLSNQIVIADGDGNPRIHYSYTSSTVGGLTIRTNSSADSTNNIFTVWNATGADIICEAGNNTTPAISGVLRLAKYTGNNRSINAIGTVNQNGADYAEYMHKAGDFTIAKGDLCGIDADGKLTNVFADAISFVVKSTDPGLVGGDNWFTEPRPVNSNGEEVPTGSPEYNAWFAQLEAARATVDRIAFCGQVPVNVMGATPGQWIIPTEDNGAIKGVAVSNPTFEQYQIAVGKVIAVEADGRAKIIVKIA